MLSAFVTQYSEVEDVKPEQWDDLFMRWRIINFLIDDGALEVQGTMLMEVDESEVALVAQEGA